MIAKGKNTTPKCRDKLTKHSRPLDQMSDDEFAAALQAAIAAPSSQEASHNAKGKFKVGSRNMSKTQFKMTETGVPASFGAPHPPSMPSPAGSPTQPYTFKGGELFSASETVFPHFDAGFSLKILKPPQSDHNSNGLAVSPLLSNLPPHALSSSLRSVAKSSERLIAKLNLTATNPLVSSPFKATLVNYVAPLATTDFDSRGVSNENGTNEGATSGEKSSPMGSIDVNLDALFTYEESFVTYTTNHPNNLPGLGLTNRNASPESEPMLHSQSKIISPAHLAYTDIFRDKESPSDSSNFSEAQKASASSTDDIRDKLTFGPGEKYYASIDTSATAIFRFASRFDSYATRPEKWLQIPSFRRHTLLRKLDLTFEKIHLDSDGRDARLLELASVRLVLEKPLKMKAYGTPDHFNGSSDVRLQTKDDYAPRVKNDAKVKVKTKPKPFGIAEPCCIPSNSRPFEVLTRQSSRHEIPCHLDLMEPEPLGIELESVSIEPQSDLMNAEIQHSETKQALSNGQEALENVLAHNFQLPSLAAAVDLAPPPGGIGPHSEALPSSIAMQQDTFDLPHNHPLSTGMLMGQANPSEIVSGLTSITQPATNTYSSFKDAVTRDVQFQDYCKIVVMGFEPDPVVFSADAIVANLSEDKFGEKLARGDVDGDAYHISIPAGILPLELRPASSLPPYRSINIGSRSTGRQMVGPVVDALFKPTYRPRLAISHGGTAANPPLFANTEHKIPSFRRRTIASFMKEKKPIVDYQTTVNKLRRRSKSTPAASLTASTLFEKSHVLASSLGSISTSRSAHPVEPKLSKLRSSAVAKIQLPTPAFSSKSDPVVSTPLTPTSPTNQVTLSTRDIRIKLSKFDAVQDGIRDAFIAASALERDALISALQGVLQAYNELQARGKFVGVLRSL